MTAPHMQFYTMINEYNEHLFFKPEMLIDRFVEIDGFGKTLSFRSAPIRVGTEVDLMGLSHRGMISTTLEILGYETEANELLLATLHPGPKVKTLFAESEDGKVFTFDLGSEGRFQFTSLSGDPADETVLEVDLGKDGIVDLSESVMLRGRIDAVYNTATRSMRFDMFDTEGVDLDTEEHLKFVEFGYDLDGLLIS